MYIRTVANDIKRAIPMDRFFEDPTANKMYLEVRRALKARKATEARKVAEGRSVSERLTADAKEKQARSAAKSDIAVLVDEEVSARVLAVLKDAEEYVVLVSPYLDLWGHAKDAIGLATRMGLKVTALIRRGQDTLKSEDLGLLIDSGVEVLCVARVACQDIS